MPVTVSSHPTVKVRIDKLRQKLSYGDMRSTIADITNILASDAVASSFSMSRGPDARSIMNTNYPTTKVSPSEAAIVPILRSGLSMVDAVEAMLPFPAPVHHLGMFREATSLSPVEYYNRLPPNEAPPLVFIIDPVIATAGTMSAALQTVHEWGPEKIVVISLIASTRGLQEISRLYPDVSVFVGATDNDLDDNGYLIPGLGDVGSRLFSV
ncbi:hypothetical protein CANCADRAFT_2462 [Tortispora caseinolytica NRRL Y-17796]|uniref:uracil phosphoribosyltransferase n=1 Tax=Tortispora caseinolytica NRRL Y-17796 TaxID=767744 RepID=A0A1E4TGA4_9ASCO|nr:hypothetical protein CANCADRAFT_2462 [Tortispora caseinolytica NRRL Y-17796]